MVETIDHNGVDQGEETRLRPTAEALPLPWDLGADTTAEGVCICEGGKCKLLREKYFLLLEVYTKC